MMKVVRNPSMQMEKFDRPMRSVNCYDNEISIAKGLYHIRLTTARPHLPPGKF